MRGMGEGMTSSYHHDVIVKVGIPHGTHFELILGQKVGHTVQGLELESHRFRGQNGDEGAREDGDEEDDEEPPKAQKDLAGGCHRFDLGI